LNTGRGFGDALWGEGAEASADGVAAANEEDDASELSDDSAATAGVAEGAGDEEVICADLCSHAASNTDTTAKGAIRGIFIRTTLEIT